MNAMLFDVEEVSFTPKPCVTILGKNGAQNVIATRRSANKMNLEEDRAVWELIVSIDEKDPNLEKTVSNDGKVKFKYKTVNHRGKLVINKEISDRLDSFKSKVISSCALMYGIDEENEVELWMIKDLVQSVLDSPETVQTAFARNASRQSVDEDAQIATVDKYTNNLKVRKPSNGSITVLGGELKQLKQIKKKQSVRSVDMVVSSGSIWKAYGFLKYSGPIGSVTDHLQREEAFAYLREAMIYCDKNNDNSKFFVQVDGYAGERHIEEMRELYPGYQGRIFAGNTEQVIDWLNSK
jgi:hypothetical protein